MRFAPEIDIRKVHVIYNGVSDEYHIVDNQEKDYRDVLFVGSRDNYKNFRFLVESLLGTDFRLIIVGNALSPKEEQFLYQTLGDERFIVYIRPDNKKLNSIYNSVLCLVYPSSYEGFGIPVVEAQRAGCPVIAYNSSSIPEVIGDRRLLLNELSSIELIRKLKMLKDESFRSEIVDSGIVNSRRFSWKNMYSQYKELYSSLE